MSLAENLQYLRAREGVTQEQLAERLAAAMTSSSIAVPSISDRPRADRKLHRATLPTMAETPPAILRA